MIVEQEGLDSEVISNTRQIKKQRTEDLARYSTTSVFANQDRLSAIMSNRMDEIEEIEEHVSSRSADP